MRACDDDVIDRHILMTTAARGRGALDGVDDVHAGYDMAEHAVAPARRRRRGEIQEVVVGHVDEKLAGCRMGIAGAGHGDGAATVTQPVVGLVVDRWSRRLLLHVGRESTALDHETVDDTMKNRLIEEAVAHIRQKIGDGLGGLFGVQVQHDLAVVGLEGHHAQTLSYRGSVLT